MKSGFRTLFGSQGGLRAAALGTGARGSCGGDERAHGHVVRKRRKTWQGPSRRDERLGRSEKLQLRHQQGGGTSGTLPHTVYCTVVLEGAWW